MVRRKAEKKVKIKAQRKREKRSHAVKCPGCITVRYQHCEKMLSILSIRASLSNLSISNIKIVGLYVRGTEIERDLEGDVVTGLLLIAHHRKRPRPENGSKRTRESVDSFSRPLGGERRSSRRKMDAVGHAGAPLPLTYEPVAPSEDRRRESSTSERTP